METTLYPPNAILFLLDLANDDIVVPEYEPGRLTAANGACISVGTRAEVDGNVTVRLLSAASPMGEPLGNLVFSGLVSTPGGKVAVVTSELKTILEIGVARQTMQVDIYVDDDESPSKICFLTSVPRKAR